MKKWLLSWMLVAVFAISSKAQVIVDTGQLRSYINSQIVPNGTKAITAPIMNRILNGFLNTLKVKPEFPDAVATLNDSTFRLTLNGESVNVVIKGSGHQQLINLISLKPNRSELSPVAFTGNFNDLINRPIIPSPFTLQAATPTTLGGIKVGANLSIDADGVLSSTGGGSSTGNVTINWLGTPYTVAIGGTITLPTPTTSSVTEGSNLYFTNSRARAVISVTPNGNASYNPATGELTVNSTAQSLQNVSNVGAITDKVLTAGGYLVSSPANTRTSSIWYRTLVNNVGTEIGYGGEVMLKDMYSAFKLKIYSADNMTSDKTISFPDKSGTVALIEDLASAGGGTAGVSSFNGRIGAVVPQLSDYASFYAALNHTHPDKLNVSDTSTMLSDYLTKTNASIIYQPKGVYLTSEVDPRRLNTLGITGSTTKTVTATLADNTTVTATFNDEGLRSETDPLSVKITDSSHIIANNYVRQDRLKNVVDSVSGAEALALSGKVNVTDTSTMLNPYLNKANATAMYQPKGTYLTSEVDPKRLTTLGVTGGATKTVTATLADNSTVTATFADQGITSEADPLSVKIADSIHTIAGNYVRQDRLKNVVDSASASKQVQLNGTGFVKQSGTTTTYDNSTYLTSNQSINFAPTGDVTGTASGATSIAPVLSIGAGKVTNAMLAGSIAANKLVGTDITLAESQVTNLTTDLTAKKNVIDSGYVKGLTAYTAIGTLGKVRDSLGGIKLNITDTANMRVRLTAGTNITITGTYPSQTISAAGGTTATLYSTTGTNTDGAMTQSATTTVLNTKRNIADSVHTIADNYVRQDRLKNVVDSAEANKAVDANVVHIAGTESITGSKTFTQGTTFGNATDAIGVNPTFLYFKNSNNFTGQLKLGGLGYPLGYYDGTGTTLQGLQASAFYGSAIKSNGNYDVAAINDGQLKVGGTGNYSIAPFVVQGSSHVSNPNIAEFYKSDGTTKAFGITYTGNLFGSTLAGTGDRMVVADLNGVLKTQAIPSSQWNYISGGINYDSLVTIGSAPTSYTLAGSNYNTKVGIKGVSSSTLTNMPLTVYDDTNRPTMNLDGNGRQNLFNYNSSGAVSVLYNLYNPAATNTVTAGHFAYGATNQSGSLNTIATLLAATTDRTPASMSSQLQLSYMDAANTTGGYTQPNKTAFLGSAGLILPSIPISGVTTLSVNAASIANAINSATLSTSGLATTNSLYVPTTANIIGKVNVGSFNSSGYAALSVDGIVSSRDQTSDNSIYTYPNEFPTAGVTLQSSNYALSAPKNLLINTQGGNVGIGYQTAPPDKLSVNGNVSSNKATASTHLVRKDQLDSLAGVKAPLASPIFTGTPKKGTDTLATLADVRTNTPTVGIDFYIDSITLTGAATSTSPLRVDTNTVATKAFVLSRPAGSGGGSTDTTALHNEVFNAFNDVTGQTDSSYRLMRPNGTYVTIVNRSSSSGNGVAYTGSLPVSINGSNVISVDTVSAVTGLATIGRSQNIQNQVTVNTTNINDNANAIAGKESSLGNPSTSGYVLSSTTAGVRSWVAQPSAPVVNLTLSAATATSQAISNSSGTGVTLPTFSTTAGLVPGTTTGTTNFLRQDGTWSIPSGTLLNTVVITSGTTYTPSTGTTKIEVELVGGGGGGGGVTGVASGSGAGTGGGGGAYVRKIITGISSGTTYTIAIGAAGAAGIANGGNGGTGGNTTFATAASSTPASTTITAAGGTGGTGSAATTSTTMSATNTVGGGGFGTNGDINVAGGYGSPSIHYSATMSMSGTGGASHLGVGGYPLTSGAGNSGVGYGGGGGGGSTNSNTNQAGGQGTVGVIIIHEYK